MFAASRRLTRFVGVNALHRLLTVLVLGIVAGGVAAGCGSSSGNDSELPGPSAADFSNRFDNLTGIRLTSDTRYDNDSWSLLSLPDGTDHFDRFGAFSIYVVAKKDAHDRLLRKSEDDHGTLEFNSSGYAFRQNEGSDSYSLVQRFGENIVLVWQAGEKQEVDESYRRLTTAVEAAATGDEDKIPAAQRDCEKSGIDPESGKEGSCRLGDDEVTIVNSGSELRTPVLKARLKSVGDNARIEPSSSYGTPHEARGRYLIVRYDVTNSGDSPIQDIEPQLIVDGRTYAPDTRADYDLYGDSAKRPLPLQPGDSATIITPFDIPANVIEAARDHGALVLPAEPDDHGYLDVDGGAAQGRIRLGGAQVDENAGGSGRDSSDSSSDPYSNPYSDPTPETEPESQSPSSSSSTRSIRRERGAERALKQFFSAVRAGSAPKVCRRLTEATLAKEGGMASCRSKVVLPKIKRAVPPSNRRLRFTTILRSGETRALVMIRRGSYRGVARLAHQGGFWRVQAMNRL